MMSGKWMHWGVLIGLLISNTQSSEENCNATTQCNATAQIIVTETEALKKIEIRNPSNGTSTNLPTPSMIQQGNNLFIKPKFIIGSPFTYHKEGHMKNAEGVSIISKTPGAEPSTVVSKPEIPQLPKIVIPRPPPSPLPALPPAPTLPPLPPLLPPPPPVIVPAGVAHNIPVLINSIPNPPKIPIAIPNLCNSMPCPPITVPIQHVPRLPVPPILVQTPPEVLPAIAPKLPIQVIPIQPHFPRIPVPPTVVQKPVYTLVSKPQEPLTPFVPKLPIQVIPIQPHIPRLPAPPVLVRTPVYPVISKPLEARPPIVPKLPIRVIPIQPHFPRLPVPPVLVQNPVFPVITKLPQIPPIVPKIPIQVIVQTPNVTTPEHRILFAPCATPCARCNSDSDTPINRMFNEIYKKFRGLMDDAYGTNTTESTKDEETSKIDKNMTDANLCAQGIITERIVPNIITNNHIKVFMTPLSPYQLAHFNNYGK